MAVPEDQQNMQRVRFGVGVRHDLAAEVDRLGSERALVLCTPQQVDLAHSVAAPLGEKSAGLFSDAAMHTPVEVTDNAMQCVKSLNADCLVAIGGGSTTGLGKALALRTGVPQIVLPTTYAGSEATPILGQTEHGVKTTLTDPKVRPDVVLYDPELVVTLPPQMTVTSGLNAMAHAAEALYAHAATPDTTARAIEGLTAFATALPRVLDAPADLAARTETLRGAWACGAVLGQVGMALHHKLCHTLGGTFDLPHAQTHAIILPHAIAYNAPAAQQALAPICELLGGTQPGAALWDFAKSLGAPLALKDLGLAEADLDHATTLATTNPYWNPRQITGPGLRSLLQDAWAGHRPNA